jgi:hypothetical protein
MSTDTPVESDTLCESCGYRLNGLPLSGNCPECGSAIDLSISERLRFPPIWENTSQNPSAIGRFFGTTTEVILHPYRFFRSLTSRGPIEPARRFAHIHWAVASTLLGLAWWFHWNWMAPAYLQNGSMPGWLKWALMLVLPMATYTALVLTEWLATHLTAFEANYRGYRLPHHVVQRALYYHAAQLFPVAAAALLTIAGHSYLRSVMTFSANGDVDYLCLLCAQIILSAVYLFHAYWIAMRNLMYANR